jgi:hypothetical protein
MKPVHSETVAQEADVESADGLESMATVQHGAVDTEVGHCSHKGAPAAIEVRVLHVLKLETANGAAKQDSGVDSVGRVCREAVAPEGTAGSDTPRYYRAGAARAGIVEVVVQGPGRDSTAERPML